MRRRPLPGDRGEVGMVSFFLLGGTGASPVSPLSSLYLVARASRRVSVFSTRHKHRVRKNLWIKNTPWLAPGSGSRSVLSLCGSVPSWLFSPNTRAFARGSLMHTSHFRDSYETHFDSMSRVRMGRRIGHCIVARAHHSGETNEPGSMISMRSSARSHRIARGRLVTPRSRSVTMTRCRGAATASTSPSRAL